MANNPRNDKAAPARKGTDDGKKAHDTHGTPFKRAPGPGPKDEGKGAAGKDAQERVEGGPQETPDYWEEREEVKEEDDEEEDKG